MALLLVFALAAALINSINSVATKFVVAGGGLRALPATFLLQVVAGGIALGSILVTRMPYVPAAMPYVFGVVGVSLCAFMLMMAAYAREDASVVGPILGLKVISLAFLESLMYGKSVGAGVWLGALVSLAAVTLISQTDKWSLHPRDLLRPGVLLMAASAAVFSVSDLFLKQSINHWHGQSWGVTIYILTLLGIVSTLALLIGSRLHVPAAQALGFHAATRWSDVRPVLLPVVVAGVTLFLYQLLFFTAFSLSKQLTLINIIYNTRVLLLVVLMTILVLGRGSTVERAGWRAYSYRISGALLTLCAILLSIYVK